MPKKFDPEMRERALRMLAEALPDHKNKSAAVRHVAGLLGMSPETLRTWARRVEVDQGLVPGPSTEVVEENRRLRREVAELRKANEVLKAASVFFAKELDRVAWLPCWCWPAVSARGNQGSGRSCCPYSRRRA